MANQNAKNFMYLRASVIDGYWFVWDQNGEEKDYYDYGKKSINRLIRKYGVKADGNYNDLYFKM